MKLAEVGQVQLPNPPMQLTGAWAPQPPRNIFGPVGRGCFGKPPQLICMSLVRTAGITFGAHSEAYMGWFSREHPLTRRTVGVLEDAKRHALISYVAIKQQHPSLRPELKDTYERHVIIASLFTAAVSLKAERLPSSTFSALTNSISEQTREWDPGSLDSLPSIGPFVEAEMERLESQDANPLRLADHAAEAIGRWVGTQVFGEQLDDEALLLDEDKDMLAASLATGRLICAKFMSYWQ